jgi:hypothetical protein
MYSVILCLLLFVIATSCERQIGFNKINKLVFDKHSLATKTNQKEVPTLKCLEDHKALCGVEKIVCGLEMKKQITSPDRWICQVSFKGFSSALSMPVDTIWYDDKVVLEGSVTSEHVFSELNIRIECDKARDEMSIWRDSCNAQYNVQKASSEHGNCLVPFLVGLFVGLILRGSGKEDVRLQWTEYTLIARKVADEISKRRNLETPLKDEEKGQSTDRAYESSSDEEDNNNASVNPKFIDVSNEEEPIKED